MELKWDDFVDAVLSMLKDIIEGITLPIGAQLIPAFCISAGITVLSVLALFFSPFGAFIDWRGALVATVALGILVVVERRGASEVSRLYRAAKSRVSAVAARAKRPGASVQADGIGDAGEPSLPADGQSGSEDNAL